MKSLLVDMLAWWLASLLVVLSFVLQRGFVVLACGVGSACTVRCLGKKATRRQWMEVNRTDHTGALHLQTFARSLLSYLFPV